MCFVGYMRRPISPFGAEFTHAQRQKTNMNINVIIRTLTSTYIFDVHCLRVHAPFNTGFIGVKRIKLRQKCTDIHNYTSQTYFREKDNKRHIVFIICETKHPLGNFNFAMKSVTLGFL